MTTVGKEKKKKDTELKAFRVNVWWITRVGLRPSWSLLTNRRSSLCVSDQRGVIAKFEHEEHLCVVALTSWSEELSSFRVPLTSLCDRLLLFVYFQVNTDSCTWIMPTSPWSSVIVSNVVLDSSLLFDDVLLLFCLGCFYGVPAWRSM